MRRRWCMAAARLTAALLLAAMGFAWGVCVGRIAPRPWELTDYDDMDAAQLSWVIEGIAERISELRDDLARAIEAQREKLNE